MKETKRCPYCGEEILAVAKKCKYCGEWLEPKVAEKAKKACPICGEMIDEDADVCPYCHEPIECQVLAESVVSTAENSSNGQEESNDGFLYCKKCGHRLSIDASVCVECGDVDPFCFKKIKKIERITCCAILGVFIMMCLGLYSVLQIQEIYVTRSAPLKLVLYLFTLISVPVPLYFMKRKIDKVAAEMKFAFFGKTNKNPMNAWWQRVRTIVGETWFSILWGQN